MQRWRRYIELELRCTEGGTSSRGANSGKTIPPRSRERRRARRDRGGMAEASVSSGKYDAYVSSGAIPRFGRPEDIARAVRFFLEPDGYVTGQVLLADGGLTLRRDQG